jgi:hypothetical protein
MFVSKAWSAPYNGAPEECFTRVDDGLTCEHVVENDIQFEEHHS